MESGADTNNTDDGQLTTHLFHEVLGDTESQTSAWGFHIITPHIWEPHFALIAIRNALARIFNRKVNCLFTVYSLINARCRELDETSVGVADRIADLKV
jgi:uncharacterized membrane protein